MKKYFLLLFMLLTAFNDLCFCQNAITQVIYPHKIVRTIVREYTYPATVSYVETEKKHYFVYADQSMTVTNCEIAPNIFVNDFVILDNEVYFCGLRNGNNPVGIWGYFDIVDLQNSNLTYNIYENFVCGNNYVDTLHRLVAYNYFEQKIQDITKHIVVVGTVTDGNRTNGCTIDITPNLSGSTMWNYTIGVTPDVTGERINRICTTKHYVITAGPAIINSDFDVYRRHYINSLFVAGGPQDEIWHFPLSSVHRYKHNAENYEITHIDKDTVAIAIQTYDLDPPNHYGVLVTAYDMGSLYNGALNTLYSHYQISNGKLNVEGLKYDYTTRQLILLLNDKVASTIAEIPLSSPNITLNTLSNNLLTSLDLYNGQLNFLCQGTDLLYPKTSTYFTQPINTTSVCAKQNSISSLDPDFITKWDPAPYTVCETEFDCTPLYQLSTFSKNNDIICSD